MFQSFTGSSRRPRQVNLSGRNANPFTPFPSGRHGPHGHGPQNTLAVAQQERILRQQERERLSAARLIQRTWRGYRSRKITRSLWRAEWDIVEWRRARDLQLVDFTRYESMKTETTGYTTAAQCLSQLRLLLHFLEIGNKDDAQRLLYLLETVQRTVQEVPTIATDDEWTTLLVHLAKTTLRVLHATATPSASISSADRLLCLIRFLIGLVPKQMAQMAELYYSVMATLTQNFKSLSKHTDLSAPSLVDSVLALLEPITSETLCAYEWFARLYLTIPDLESHLGTLVGLAAGINYKLLASSLDECIDQYSGKALLDQDADSRLWLLAYFIYFHRHALSGTVSQQAPEPKFVKVMSQILNSMASYVSRRLETDEFTENERNQSLPLPPFVREQMFSLVNQTSITGLLSRVRSTHFSQATKSDASDDARILATYALTLLRVFPRRGDEIRMWLYLGSASSGDQNSSHQPSRMPAIKYFWRASRSTRIFTKICQGSNEVLSLLKPVGSNDSPRANLSVKSLHEREQEWTIILLFLELYTFVLKVMDDEEFFSGGSSFSVSSTRVSWTKESALPLRDVKDMTVFLKNLAFTLYWNAADLNGAGILQDTGGIRNYFSASFPPLGPMSNLKDMELKSKDKGLSGVVGIPLDYFKGLVTGLLRMIHERDSRRKFLPDGHWLMTSRFDMDGFIPAVVAEEENRHQLQEEDEDGETQDSLFGDMFEQKLIGTSRIQQARRKQLEAIAPRLEILRNMPFFIPFATRVQIFREFIYRDQMRRRHGNIDPDSWRMSVVQNSVGRMIEGRQDILRRHHADISRDNVFEDAFEHFYELGEGLKEPIQISFIDKFGALEAGIDGGGVTKEFLTSVTNEAFRPSNGLDLFVENDQNLLYPNPVAVEQRKESLRQLSVAEGSLEWNERVRDLLRRYEFLGRIIGKCLYEGILVDVHFAGFFLLKWALTGGTGSAQKESAYRANLNDLRDLDEGLYQGLLQLKNYTGDVEDFSLNFTISDTISVPGSKTRTITRELKLNGADLPVTNQNRLVYISYVARHRLQVQPFYQTNAFLQGLGQIIQPSWLSMFNQSELQTLVGGDSGDIDVSDLRRNTLYGGVYAIGDDKEEHPTVKLFWEAMEGMTNE
ncbi:hypothetical protein Egran_05870, partial [Elaphomyces granulatus]